MHDRNHWNEDREHHLDIEQTRLGADMFFSSARILVVDDPLPNAENQEKQAVRCRRYGIQEAVGHSVRDPYLGKRYVGRTVHHS